jgi:hypothetical protein
MTTSIVTSKRARLLLGLCVLAAGACLPDLIDYGAPCEDGECPAQFRCIDDACVTGCEDDRDCRDDVFCNGFERCERGACVDGPPPCPGDTCDEDRWSCDLCSDDATCDDGVYCDGAERCVEGACAFGAAPCVALCEEASASCGACASDADCDDGVFCNGPEACTAGVCEARAAPCGAALCDESTGQCGGCSSDDQCGALEVCNAQHACVACLTCKVP